MYIYTSCVILQRRRHVALYFVLFLPCYSSFRRSEFVFFSPRAIFSRNVNFFSRTTVSYVNSVLSFVYCFASRPRNVVYFPDAIYIYILNGKYSTLWSAV